MNTVLITRRSLTFSWRILFSRCVSSWYHTINYHTANELCQMIFEEQLSNGAWFIVNAWFLQFTLKYSLSLSSFVFLLEIFVTWTLSAHDYFSHFHLLIHYHDCILSTFVCCVSFTLLFFSTLYIVSIHVFLWILNKNKLTKIHFFSLFYFFLRQ